MLVETVEVSCVLCDYALCCRGSRVICKARLWHRLSVCASLRTCSKNCVSLLWTPDTLTSAYLVKVALNNSLRRKLQMVRKHLGDDKEEDTARQIRRMDRSGKLTAIQEERERKKRETHMTHADHLEWLDESSLHDWNCTGVRKCAQCARLKKSLELMKRKREKLLTVDSHVTCK